MHRSTVGIITLALFLAALLASLGGDQAKPVQSGCLRVGILMGAFWLAMPRLKGVRPLWVALGLILGVVALVIAVRQPFAMALLAIIALLLGYLSISSRARRSR